MLTAERCRELLDYDARSGRLTWRHDRHSGFGRVNVRAGDEAGHVNGRGYRIVRLDGQSYRAHRVIWLMLTGEMPIDEIDHINGDRADNRRINLRQATRAQNAKNVGMHSSNKSGFKGVCWDSAKGRWRADIAGDWIGHFDSAEEASAAYELAAAERFGDFRRAA